MLSKVPEVTIYFWIIKILATTVGETAADSLNADAVAYLTITRTDEIPPAPAEEPVPTADAAGERIEDDFV